MADFFGFILYPVSAVLWFWHKVFGFLLGPDNGFAWALSVFFLVFSLRVILLKPALSQIRSSRKMAKFAPQMQKVREKYKNDRQTQMQEMQKLQSEQGVNPLGGCLPALLQIPVFLSLFHVLRNFKPWKDQNYIFGPEGVDSFVDAHIFGAKLANWLTQSEETLEQFGTTRFDMIMVGIPLMIIASVATYFTMRMSVKRQNDATMTNPQSAMIGKVMMYLAPVGALISGWFLPLAVLLYWLANNVWTLGQQHFLTNKVDREEQRQKEADIAAKKEAPRPKPGQKPAEVSNGKAEQTDDSERGEDPEAAQIDGAQLDAESSSGGASVGKFSGKPTAGGRPGGKTQQKNRPGKQAASAKKKSQKKKR